MFDDLVSTPEVDSAGALDYDPRRSVEISEETSPLLSTPMTPRFNPDRHPSDVGGIDGLVRHMRRQTLIPDSHSQSPPTPGRLGDRQETTIPLATIESTSESSMQLEHQQRQPQTLGEQIKTCQSTNDASYPSSDAKRLRRKIETRHCKSSSSLRSLDLMTGMIENGVQCNVRSSTPPTPVPALQPAQLVFSGPLEPQNMPGQDMFEGAMNLEVDFGYSEQDDEDLLNEALALRHAGAPAGAEDQVVGTHGIT
ncbi:hypothetical protein F5X99DRAFT_428022 [Biscogniauxia marginata]|nr:hypothetical protein F5X99DRAFT_428022 [Biscogniauxia marginata]